MTDPSIEAVQRVLASWSEDGEPEGAESYLAVSAAREMAKSVQELHRKVLHNGNWVCHTCWQPYDLPQPWPCETAKRVYPSEELGL